MASFRSRAALFCLALSCLAATAAATCGIGPWDLSPLTL
jgi:hypothetical protein